MTASAHLPQHTDNTGMSRLVTNGQPPDVQHAIFAENVIMQYRVPKRYREYLLKPFRSRTYIALDDFTLCLPEGGSLAVLGPNGSGKTTLLRLLAGLLYPSQGKISIKGYPSTGACDKKPYGVGIVLNEERSFYWRLTGRQNLEFFGSLDNLFGIDARRRAAEVLDRVGLTQAADVRVSDYSSGMRQRLAIARGLLSDPDLLILDEPTKSLDPVGAADLRDAMRDWSIRRPGATLVVATHSMTEAEKLCSHVCILSAGKLLCFRPLDEVSGEFTGLDDFYRHMLDQEEKCHACT